jgi:xylulokinase
VFLRVEETSPLNALVWWKSTVVPSLSSLDPHVLLHSHCSLHNFSLPNTPTAQGLSPHAIHACPGDRGSLRVRETWPQDVWARTGRIQLASAFMCSLIIGKWQGMSEAEACAMGMWIHGANTSAGANDQGHWDKTVLDIIGGGREEGR